MRRASSLAFLAGFSAWMLPGQVSMAVSPVLGSPTSMLINWDSSQTVGPSVLIMHANAGQVQGSCYVSLNRDSSGVWASVYQTTTSTATDPYTGLLGPGGPFWATTIYSNACTINLPNSVVTPTSVTLRIENGVTPYNKQVVANYSTPCTGPWWQCGWGNNTVSSTIGWWDATPTPPSDTTPPVISQPATTVSGNSVRVVWSTDEGSSTQVLISGAGSSTYDGSLRIYHTAVVSGLTPGVTYSYEVRSADTAGNLSTRTGQFRTAPDLVSSMGTVTGTRAGIAPDVSIRFEPTSARGASTWVTGWYDQNLQTSLLSYSEIQHFADGTDSQIQQPLSGPPVWGHPPTRVGAVGTRFVDLNVTWDASRSRFVYVALNKADNGIYYGWSATSIGESWTSPTCVLRAPSGQQWDYPSIAISGLGQLMVGAVLFNVQSPTAQGYQTLLLNNPSPSVTGCDTSIPAVGIAVVSGLDKGHYTRIVATKTKFHAFVPVLNTSRLPVGIDRYESSGSSWQAPIGVIAGGFLPPLRTLDFPVGGFPAKIGLASAHIDAAAIAGAGDEGEWAIAFQEAFGTPSRNIVGVCSSTRGCGRVNQNANPQFYPGVTFAPDRSLWHTYTTVKAYEDTVPIMEVHGWLIRGSEPPYGVVARQDINPLSWTKNPARCFNSDEAITTECYIGGDFFTISAAANRLLVPFIQQRGSANSNDLNYMFVRPPASGYYPASAGPWYPFGTALPTAGGQHSQTGLALKPRWN